MNKQLKNYSDEELLKELEGRKKNKNIVPLFNPNFTKLVEAVRNHVESTLNEGPEDNDDSHFIYEIAVEAIYGKEIWKIFNEQ